MPKHSWPPAAGWYPDADRPHLQRWWTGEAWSCDVRLNEPGLLQRPAPRNRVRRAIHFKTRRFLEASFYLVAVATVTWMLWLAHTDPAAFNQYFVPITPPKF